jgi:hypothetical protein
VGLLRESDPSTFEETRKLVLEVNELSTDILGEFVESACKSARNLRENMHEPVADADILQFAIRPAAKVARDQRTAAESDKAAREAYEADRAAWIAEAGSKRLRVAAQRGYRHDGLYRDERLAAELPGFVGRLGRHTEVKEIINPSEAALDLETEVIRQTKTLGLNVSVRLVFVAPSVEIDLAEGEYVEVAGYLGRHKVYRPVDATVDFRPADDDIPF